jgi:methyl acetate hydrolase
MSARIDEVLQSAVAAGDVPNVVAMAADDGGVIYEGAAGRRRPDADDAVTPDSMLRIASMTKMVATVAALQQVERGNLDLNAPVDEYRPEFAQVHVLDGFDGDTPRLRPPVGRATVRHLMTHTSGLSYWFWNEDIVRWEQVTGTPNVMSGSEVVFTAPLVADPGARFEYGINTDWLGRVVEAASGESLDAYLAANVLGPLGMRDTTFVMNDEQRARSVPIHLRGDDGAWAASDLDWSQSPDWWAGGHGLYSTPRDYLAFQRMLLGGGTLGDAKILERATVEAAFTNQIGNLRVPELIRTADPAASDDFHAGPGKAWGYGLMLNTEQEPGMRAAGSGAWAGLFNTHFWVDPATRVTGAIYAQTLPFVEPRVLRVYVDFERALYASLPAAQSDRPRFETRTGAATEAR